MTLDRYDVSILFNPHTNKIALQEEKEGLYEELEVLYNNIYEFREALKNEELTEEEKNDILKLLQKEVKQAHKYFKPYAGNELRA